MKRKTTQPKGFTKAQVRAAVKARDSAKPNTPGAVLEAFVPEQLLAGGYELQPVTLSVMMVLQRIKSALIKQEADFSVWDIGAAVLVLTRPITEIRALLLQRRDDRFPLFDAEVDLLCDVIPAGMLGEIGDKLNAHLIAAFANLVPHGIAKGAGADTPFPAGRTPGPAAVGS